MKPRIHFAALVFLGLSGTSTILPAAPYILTDLGTLGADASATGINDQGEVVGYATTGVGGLFPPGEYHAYYYSRASGVITLPSLGGREAIARAIHPWGNYVVGTSKDAEGIWKAFLYEVRSGTMIDLEAGGPAPARGSDARAVSFAPSYSPFNGLVIAGSSYAAPGSPSSEATSWFGFSHFRQGHGGNTIQVNGVNPSATIVGQMNLNGNDTRAFAYRQEDGIAVLPTLGGSYTTATAINRNSWVVGWGDLSGDDVTHAFLTVLGNPAILDLGAFGDFPDRNSEANAINDLGHIVGWAEDDSGQSRAFLHKDGRMSDINAFLPSGSGWILTEATGINRLGQIVGKGIKDDLVHSFLLTPPPSFAILGSAQHTRKVTLKNKYKFRGVSTAGVSSVTYRVGNRGKFKTALGAESWQFTAALKPGLNRITIVAHGPGGSSPPMVFRVIRR